MRMSPHASIALLALGLTSFVASAAPVPAPEEPRKDATPTKVTPTPAAARKAPAREAAPPKAETGKTDPRGLQVEPVDFKKAPEKPKPK